MDPLTRIALDRLNLLAAPAGPPPAPELAAAALADLARTGVRLTNPEELTEPLARTAQDLVAHERARRGQYGTFVPLFAGFPDALPTLDLGWLRALLAATRLAGVPDPTPDQLRDALDFTAYGWWPASSVPQDVPATLLARAHQDTLPADGHIEWTTLRVVTVAARDEALREYMATTFASPVSLREDVTADLADLAEHFGVGHIDAATVTFREIRTLLARQVWATDLAALPALNLTPDDLLRLLAALSGSDASLMEPVRFPKLSRAQRRTVVAALEASPRLSDVFRRRGLWLAIARGLHLSAAHAPKTTEAFTRLRATRHDTHSLPSRFERTLTSDFPAAVDLLASEAPTVLLRSLRRLASLAATDTANQQVLLEALATCAPNVPLRVLLTARNQIADNGATYPRPALTKAGGVLLIDRAPGHLELAGTYRARVLEQLGAAVHSVLAARPSWVGERVHIEAGLDRVLVPEALRTTSAGLIQVERGSALPAGDGAAVRLFVHWKHAESDLDLSLLALDENFDVLAHVAYTNLADGKVVHSGDITSAPAGAQEFIDIDLDYARSKMAQARWRYLAPAIYRYSGPTFAELEEGVTGWMLRENTSADRMTFDPAAVVNAFELTGAARTAIPFVLDLATNEIVYLDVTTGGAPGASAARNGQSVGDLARALVARRPLKTDVDALVREHVLARGGTLAASKAEATITVGTTSDCTYDALRPEKLLADLL